MRDPQSASRSAPGSTRATGEGGPLVAQVLAGTAVLDAEGLSTREINVALARLLQEGATDIDVPNAVGQHCLAVALKTQARIHFKGSVGWYAAGMNDGAHIVIDGNCGWGL